MDILKYFGLPLLSIALAFLASYQEHCVASKTKATLLRCVFLGLSVILIVIQGVVAWRDDIDAATNRKDLEERIDDAKNRNEEMRDDLVSNRTELAGTRAELQRAHSELAQANSNLTMQSRSIGSLVFNLGTSLEGKRRFMRCFQDLSRMTSRREKSLVYEGLICDDGVAMFGFEQEPERLKEFYFFTSAEINYALSGTPLEDHFIDADGKVSIRVGSELDLIMRMIESKLPPWSADELECARALGKVDEQMRVLLRYVYRAVSVNTDWCRDKVTNEIVSRRVAFSYAANPLAKDLRILTADIEIPKGDMKAYFGLTVRDFNSRLIGRFFASGIEPKVRSKDVRGLNGRAQERENRRTSPYRN